MEYQKFPLAAGVGTILAWDYPEEARQSGMAGGRIVKEMKMFETKLRNVALGAVAVAGLFAASSAVPANAITIDGITFDGGSVLQTATIYENTVLAAGVLLNGIGTVEAIKNNATSVTTWQSGDNGRELTFAFQNYRVESISAPIDIGLGQSAVHILFSGGTTQFYSDSSPDFTATSGSQATDVARATDGNLWLNLAGAGTGTICDATCFSGAGTVITLDSTIIISGSDLAAINSGNGFGFLDVLGGGLADGNFDTDSFPSGQDFSLNSSFNAANGVGTDWPLGGSANTIGTAIPEPLTIGLLGFGLLGLGLARRRRNA